MDAVTPLRMDAVSFGYGPETVLERVSLEVRSGESVALLGANGAGKTTLTRLAMALRHPGSGRVVTAGRDTAHRSPEDLAEVAGYLFQHPEAQLFARTVRAEVAFGPERLGWTTERTRAAVEGVLAELGLSALAGSHPYDLPQPTRRLVALAAALVRPSETPHSRRTHGGTRPRVAGTGGRHSARAMCGRRRCAGGDP